MVRGERSGGVFIWRTADLSISAMLSFAYLHVSSAKLLLKTVLVTRLIPTSICSTPVGLEGIPTLAHMATCANVADFRNF